MESAISQNIIYNPTLTASRYQQAISNVLRYQGIIDFTTPLKPPASSQGGVLYDDFPVEILLHLVTSILLIPRKWVRGSRLSKRILYAAACVGALGLYEVRRILELSEQTFRWLAVTEDVDLGLELEHCKTRAEAAAAGPLITGDMRVISFPPRQKDRLQTPCAEALFERCEICGESVGWQDVATARCANNHIFVRCALTFLAIQGPRISKYCGVCGKEYLREDIIRLEKVGTLDEGGESAQAGIPNTEGLAKVLLEAAMEVGADDTASLPSKGGRAPDSPIARELSDMRGAESSLASLLFGACDVCVYCGGKFLTDGTI
ncbi:MAG: hypothetical protein M1839_006403 [Geoglossum umbratile]|nr:MAG: hypothetical protein M1839_006403 [Geoglossum umbratile]